MTKRARDELVTLQTPLYVDVSEDYVNPSGRVVRKKKLEKTYTVLERHRATYEREQRRLQQNEKSQDENSWPNLLDIEVPTEEVVQEPKPMVCGEFTKLVHFPEITNSLQRSRCSSIISPKSRSTCTTSLPVTHRPIPAEYAKFAGPDVRPTGDAETAARPMTYATSAWLRDILSTFVIVSRDGVAHISRTRFWHKLVYVCTLVTKGGRVHVALAIGRPRPSLRPHR